MQKKIIGILGIVSLGLLAISGCTKTVTVVVNPGSSITKELSFANDITPIFEKSCALSGCHASGGKQPDLSSKNAYQSLMSGGYVKAFDPEHSELMYWLTGKKSPVMPLGNGPNQDINAYIYAWIKQGAKNN